MNQHVVDDEDAWRTPSKAVRDQAHAESDVESLAHSSSVSSFVSSSSDLSSLSDVDHTHDDKINQQKATPKPLSPATSNQRSEQDSGKEGSEGCSSLSQSSSDHEAIMEVVDLSDLSSTSDTTESNDSSTSATDYRSVVIMDVEEEDDVMNDKEKEEGEESAYSLSADEDDSDSPGDDDIDALWRDLDAAIAVTIAQGAIEYEMIGWDEHELHGSSFESEDDGYDASESASCSSGCSGSSDCRSTSTPSELSSVKEVSKWYAPFSFVVDSSLDSSSSESSLLESSVSSAHSLREDNEIDDLDSLSDTDGKHNDSGRRGIENVPVSWAHAKPMASEGPQVYHTHQFIHVAAANTSDDDLDLSPDEQCPQERKPRHQTSISSRRLSRGITDLSHHNAYVTYGELAGILAQVVPRRPSVILDIGCGTSRLCDEMVLHGYRTVHGIDCDPRIVAFQREQRVAQQLPSYVQYHMMDVSIRLNYTDKTCDVIIATATLDAIASADVRAAYPHALVTTLMEIVRCLKPGGVLLAVSYVEHWMDGATHTDQEVVDAFERCEIPWWTWPEVSRLLGRQLVLVDQHALGVPRMVDGIPTKPYRVLVWRRRETEQQRLRRLQGELRDKQWMRYEYAVKLRNSVSLRQRREDEERMIEEARRMIREDELARRLRYEQAEPLLQQARGRRLALFYAAVLEQDRLEMIVEDEASYCLRKYENNRERSVLIAAVVAQLIDTSILKSESKNQSTSLTQREEAKTQATTAAPSAEPSQPSTERVRWKAAMVRLPQPQGDAPTTSSDEVSSTEVTMSPTTPTPPSPSVNDKTPENSSTPTITDERSDHNDHCVKNQETNPPDPCPDPRHETEERGPVQAMPVTSEFDAVVISTGDPTHAALVVVVTNDSGKTECAQVQSQSSLTRPSIEIREPDANPPDIACATEPEARRSTPESPRENQARLETTHTHEDVQSSPGQTLSGSPRMVPTDEYVSAKFVSIRASVSQKTNSPVKMEASPSERNATETADNSTSQDGAASTELSNPLDIQNALIEVIKNSSTPPREPLSSMQDDAPKVSRVCREVLESMLAALDSSN